MKLKLQCHTHTCPITSGLLNEAELFFTDTLSRLNLNSSAGRVYSNLSGWMEIMLIIITIDSRLWATITGVSDVPLIKLRTEVPFLHGRLLLGCFALVWQQHERDVAVDAIFALRQQTSVQQKQEASVCSHTDIQSMWDFLYYQWIHWLSEE